MLSSITHALKEWGVAVEALEAGDTSLLLRKGGIREVGGHFGVQYEQVLLYPTYEHQKPHLLKPHYAERVTPVASGWHPETFRIGSWAFITNIFAVSDETAVKQLIPYHIWNEEFVSERLHWKPRQPLYLLVLRVYRLPQPLIISYRQEYGGCRSWLNLVDSVSLTGSVPVLEEAEHAQRLEAIKAIAS